MGSARALTVTAESLENHTSSGCDSFCSSHTNLNYTHDQADYFIARMVANGHVKKHQYKDGSLWASDVIEDALGGSDHMYTDDSDVYLFAGHGGVSGYSGYSAAGFVGVMSKKGAYSSCRFDNKDIVWGEQHGPYAAIHPGKMKYAFLMTCSSVEDSGIQWKEVFSKGLDYLFGYQGLSSDSPFTDEVAGDMANEAFGSIARKFKPSWFWAVEDWWIDDMGAVASSGGRDIPGEAEHRRDNMTKNTPRRAPYAVMPIVSLAFHAG